MQNRLLHLKMGYPSLLAFCVQELKYSESTAYRRISALRLSTEVPELKEQLQSGELTFQAVAQVQTFINQEKKHSHKIYSVSEKICLVKEVTSKNTRQIEQLLAEKSPCLIKPETSRQISATQRQVVITISNELDNKLKDLRSRYSHKNPNPTLAELIEILSDEILKREQTKTQRAHENFRKKPLSADEVMRQKTTKRAYIPVGIRYEVRRRSQSMCSYVDQQTGKRCESKHQLEIEHIQPLALGGSNDITNLRLACRNHNMYFAKQAGLNRKAN